MIYFFYNRERHEVKIGFCEESRVFDRLAEVQTGCSSRLQFIAQASMPGKRPQEFALHKRFARLRVHGEWFRCDAELKVFLFDRMTMGMAEQMKEKEQFENENPDTVANIAA